jgi:two-component system sensor histidine kinase PilS (NtrC family)
LAIDSGQQVGYILSFQDLTEIKTREEQLQLKEKMAAIGQVAAGLAHELRNPLGALSGSIQILRSELQPSGESARLIEIVLRECDRLNKTVGDFLIYAGPRPMKRQSVDVVPLLLDTVELCKNTPEFQTGHSIEVKAPASLHGKLDPDLIRQAVWNVIQNALRAMPNGGKLAVSATVNESSLGLRFADEGVGMNDEDKRRLFEPFHSGFKKGVGLGMAIVYQIVQQHAGRIEVESAPGVGTQILITLPGDWRSA